MISNTNDLYSFSDSFTAEEEVAEALVGGVVVLVEANLRSGKLSN